MYRNRVFVSPPRQNDIQIKIENSEWLFLQGDTKGSKLGGHLLSPETRNQLVKVTNLYASSLRNAEHTEPLGVVLKKLMKWVNATDALRDEIWKTKEENDSDWLTWANRIAAKETKFETVQETLLSPSPSDLEKQYPLALLSRVLKGSILTAVSVHTELQQQWTSHQRYLWFIWAAMVFSILGRAGIPVKHPKRKNLLDGSLELLEKLQKKLPSDLQLRGPKNDDAKRAVSDSFRKGAVIAYKLRKGNPTSSLQNILTRWAQGQSEQPYPKGSPEVDILLRLRRLTTSSGEV